MKIIEKNELYKNCIFTLIRTLFERPTEDKRNEWQDEFNKVTANIMIYGNDNVVRQFKNFLHAFRNLPSQKSMDYIDEREKMTESLRKLILFMREDTGIESGLGSQDIEYLHLNILSIHERN